MKVTLDRVSWMTAALLVCGGGAIAGDACIMNTRVKCCDIVSIPPLKRSHCSNQPANENCDDLILANPEVDHVVSMASGGFHSAEYQSRTSQNCVYQIRLCNELGNCATDVTVTQTCYPTYPTLGASCGEN